MPRSKPTFKDIFGLHIKYIEYLLAKSYLSHQFLKNVHLSGSEIEVEIRSLFQNILPKRYKVTHGYIVSAISVTNEPKISPQVDMIIVDTLVPHSIFLADKNSGMEIVPVECVVGIFEIKRKIDKASLLSSDGALNHLKNILTSVDIDPNKSNKDRYLPGGLKLENSIQGGYYSNPMVGVIGLTHIKNIDHRITNILNEAISNNLHFIDMILSVDGMFLAPKTPGTTNFQPIHVDRMSHPKDAWAMTTRDKSNTQAKVLSQSIGFMILYITLTCGRVLNVSNYFYNKNVS